MKNVALKAALSAQTQKNVKSLPIAGNTADTKYNKDTCGKQQYNLPTCSKH